MIGSDGDIQVTSERGHPRSSATFPSFLREFVVKRRTLSFMEAIRRATSLPTQVFGLAGRGTLEPGERADVCVVPDPRLSDNVEKGIWPRHLFVGGEPVILRSEALPSLPGHVVLDRRLK
jgi:N-acyl-D-aspartate/D-glutamate deacylase